jgi:hypothetical protein
VLRGVLALVALLVFARLVLRPLLGAVASPSRASADAPEALAAGAAAPPDARRGGGAAALASASASPALAPPAEGVKALRAWLAQS